MQTISLLAEDRAEGGAGASQGGLGYSSMQLGMQAACVGMYLVDLLHLASLAGSPMQIRDPQAFLAACAGQYCLQPYAASTFQTMCSSPEGGQPEQQLALVAG